MRDALRLVRSGGDDLSVAVKSAQLIRDIVFRLRAHIRENPFPNRQDEIRYFKFWAPRFFGRLFYYRKVSDILIHRLHASPDRLEAILRKEMETIEEFYYRHEELCKMYYLKDNSLDDRLFVRNVQENRMFDEVEIIMDSDFCVGSYLASRLYANLRLRDYLDQQLNKEGPEQVENKAPGLIFTDDKTNAGELIILFFLLKCFNNGKAQLKEIVQWFEINANIKVGNIHVIWQEIKRRKTGITKYLDRGRELIVNKAADED